MPKRSSKKKDKKEGQEPDVNELAASIIEKATAEGKNPAAVMLGRMGGLKGGKARAKKLSAKKRKEIAKKAAKARWDKKKPKPIGVL